MLVKWPFCISKKGERNLIIKEKPFNDWQLPDTDPNKVVVAFDSEYQSGTRNHISIGGVLIDVNQRQLEDIISIQLGFNYQNKSSTLYFAVCKIKLEK